MTYTIIFRVLGSDVFEMPIEARSYLQAQRRALEYWGLSRDAVVMCHNY